MSLTDHVADARDTSPLINQSVVDEKDAAGEVAAVVMAAVEDAISNRFYVIFP